MKSFLVLSSSGSTGLYVREGIMLTYSWNVFSAVLLNDLIDDIQVLAWGRLEAHGSKTVQLATFERNKLHRISGWKEYDFLRARMLPHRQPLVSTLFSIPHVFFFLERESDSRRLDLFSAETAQAQSILTIPKPPRLSLRPHYYIIHSIVFYIAKKPPITPLGLAQSWLWSRSKSSPGALQR